MALQTYASFDLGWFLVLGLEVAGFWGLLPPDCRPWLPVALRRQLAPLAASLLAATLALLPLAPPVCAIETAAPY